MNEWNFDNGYDTAVQAENELTLRRYVAGVMRRVYGKMTLGLLLTAITAFLVVSSPAVLSFLFSSTATIWILFALEIGLVIYLSARIDKLSNGVATALFYAYSALNGIALTPIFLAYTGTSIAMTFALTAGTFGAMTIFGYVTRQDLSKIGSFLFMALIGLIVCSLVNLFMQSTMMEFLISCAGVLIFVGLTAWDTQYIKRMTAEADSTMVGKVATMGALRLYLDFINLFLYLLRFFGSRD
ncbi:MAG: Bax inhibitor-1/YccA family protein [Muribaculaceae bacterium]|nr:Bax inhibitor-1/YccA family protein [Muribaculaceae bacterium]